MADYYVRTMQIAYGYPSADPSEPPPPPQERLEASPKLPPWPEEPSPELQPEAMDWHTAKEWMFANPGRVVHATDRRWRYSAEAKMYQTWSSSNDPDKWEHSFSFERADPPKVKQQYWPEEIVMDWQEAKDWMWNNPDGEIRSHVSDMRWRFSKDLQEYQTRADANVLWQRSGDFNADLVLEGVRYVLVETA